MRTPLGETAPMRAPNSTVGRQAIADADRRRAASPRIVDVAGSHVAACELFYDSTVPTDIRRQAEAQDARDREERRADPLADALHQLRSAEQERNVALAGLERLTPFLRDHASTPDDEYVAMPHGDGCCHASMSTLRQEAHDYRETIAGAVLAINALNLAVARLVREAA